MRYMKKVKGTPKEPKSPITRSDEAEETTDQHPDWDHTPGKRHAFLMDLQVWLEEQDTNFALLWEQGTVSLAKTTAVKHAWHARLLQDGTLVFGTFAAPFPPAFDQYRTNNPASIATLSDTSDDLTRNGCGKGTISRMHRT